MENILYKIQGISETQGKGIIANQNIQKDQLILQIQGKEIESYEKVPQKHKCHCIYWNTEKDIWLIGENEKGEPYDWIYLNHSCDPNSQIIYNIKQGEGWIQALRQIKQEEQITIHYAKTTLQNLEKYPETHFWDDQWSFDCQCKQQNCCKRLKGYIIDN